MGNDSATKNPPPPKDPGGHAERLSIQALEIPFVGRREELTRSLEHLLSIEPDGRAAVIHGDSGTGKTFFARELMRRAHEMRPEALYLYIDIANDEYQSSRAIAALLKISLVSGPMSGTSTISVPETLGLTRYRRQARRRGAGGGLLRALAQALGAALGLGSAVSAALPPVGVAGTPQVEDELASYLAWAAKREMVLLAIDNIQFLNLDARLTVESVLQRVGRNIRLLALDRTSEGHSELDPPVRCFAEALLDLTIGSLTRADTEQVVIGTIGGDPSTMGGLAEDIFSKTGGLAKDVEYCLRQYTLELGRGARVGAIEGLLSTIDRLPLIHRQFLMIAVLLEGGVKQAIARGTVRRLATASDAASLDSAVRDLLARDYLRVNSDSGDRLRPGHERIANAIRELADEDLQEDVRRSLIEELRIALEQPDADDSETYLLHCLVGLQTARELARNLDYICRLIQSQYRQDQFSYLVAITDELQDMLPLLPEHVLNDLLDAMQKSSAFEKGLQVVRLLNTKGVPGASGRRIHCLKYLTQAYQYDEALALSEQLGDDDWAGVYRVNALMALDRFEEARVIAEAQLSEPISERGAVMRRNTITLFDSERALMNLDAAYEYFEREQSDFRLATVDTNRGLVWLHAGRPNDALRVLDRAVQRMGYVGSREIYQAQVNLAVRSALAGDHQAALDSLDDAGVHVPRALILDQVKIRMNRAVIEHVSGVTDARAFEGALLDCIQRIRGLQMPYLQRALGANLACVRGESPRSQMTARELVSLEIPLGAEDPGRPGNPWTLLMSVHWRY